MHEPAQDLENQSDSLLLERFRRGEEDAATSLYVRYSERIFRLASYQTSESLSYQVGSEEIVQTVFRTFFRRAATGQYHAVDGDELWKLLLVIALNKIRKKSEFHRAQKRDFRRSKSLEGIRASVDAQVNTDDTAFSVLRMTVNDLLSSFSNVHRKIIELRIQGCKLQEIADKTGRSKRTAERVLQEFKEQLLKSLAEQDER